MGDNVNEKKKKASLAGFLLAWLSGWVTADQYKVILTDHLHPRMKHFLTLMGKLSSRMPVPQCTQHQG